MCETLELLRGSLPSNITLHYAADDSTCVAHIDPSHLENALVNLALNARDAMPQGGRLSFHTHHQSVTTPLIRDETVPPGDYLEIVVTDTGCGFTEMAKQLAYEPFFTTKSGSNNSGLGLSMVYGFVKQSQGYISIDNLHDKGAYISLLLPLAHSPIAPTIYPPKEWNSQATQALKDKLLLLVEDNPDVRAVVREQLIQLGLHVVEADNADEALHLIDNLPNLDGMVSDIMLSGSLDGRQLAYRLHHKHPRSIILLISGYSHDASPEAANGVTFPLLRKPFDQQSLSHALWQASQQEEKQP